VSTGGRVGVRIIPGEPLSAGDGAVAFGGAFSSGVTSGGSVCPGGGVESSAACVTVWGSVWNSCGGGSCVPVGVGVVVAGLDWATLLSVVVPPGGDVMTVPMVWGCGGVACGVALPGVGAVVVPMVVK
jgi:hypothetical protein